MTEKILVKVSTDEEIREEFLECFGNRAEIIFCDGEISENDLKTATVIVLGQAPNESYASSPTTPPSPAS